MVVTYNALVLIDRSDVPPDVTFFRFFCFLKNKFLPDHSLKRMSARLYAMEVTPPLLMLRPRMLLPETTTFSCSLSVPSLQQPTEVAIRIKLSSCATTSQLLSSNVYFPLPAMVDSHQTYLSTTAIPLSRSWLPFAPHPFQFRKHLIQWISSTLPMILPQWTKRFTRSSSVCSFGPGSSGSRLNSP